MLSSPQIQDPGLHSYVPTFRSRLLHHLPVLAAALFAICWLVARAHIQSVTIDEADTYIYYAHPDTWWAAGPNNHVLNTLLILLFTRLFGLSNLTLRLPALVGAAIYIASASSLCAVFIRPQLLRFLVFLCLTYNPFVMDYLVAARGYGLALGLLLASVTLFSRQLFLRDLSSRNIYRDCALGSLCIGLSFTANFSFAFADASILGLFLLFTFFSLRNKITSDDLSNRPRTITNFSTVLVASILPAAAIAALLCGRTLLAWSKAGLVYGSTSLAETWRGIFSASFYELAPSIADWFGPRWTKRIPEYLVLFLLAVFAIQIIRIAIGKSWRNGSGVQRPVLTGAYIVSVVLLSLLLHLLSFRFFGILLPKNRTSLFFVPLCTIAVAIACSVPYRTKLRRLMGPVSIAAFSLCALYFVCCLRLRYFQEWKFDADAQPGYLALRNEVGAGRSVAIPSDWLYSSAFNFYRLYYRDNSFAPFQPVRNSAFPTGRKAYVLNSLTDGEFIRKHHLKIAYSGKLTDLVIAIPPQDGHILGN